MKTILGNKTWNGFHSAGARNRATYALGDTFCVYATLHNGEWSYGACHYLGRERGKDLPKPTDKRAVVRIRVIPKQCRTSIFEMTQKIRKDYVDANRR